MAALRGWAGGGASPGAGPARPRPFFPWKIGSGIDGGGEDDGVRRRVGTERAEERLAGEVEDPAVGCDHQIAVAVADHADHRLVEPGGAHGASEGSVTE